MLPKDATVFDMDLFSPTVVCDYVRATPPAAGKYWSPCRSDEVLGNKSVPAVIEVAKNLINVRCNYDERYNDRRTFLREGKALQLVCELRHQGSITEKQLQDALYASALHANAGVLADDSIPRIAHEVVVELSARVILDYCGP